MKNYISIGKWPVVRIQIALIGFLLSIVGWSLTVLPAMAQIGSFSMVLTIHNTDGEPVIAAVNGQTVVVGWYIDGPLTNCRIQQDNSITGITIIHTVETLPASDSAEVTPPPDSSTTFRIECDQRVAETSLNYDQPTANLTSDQGLYLVNDPLTGRVRELRIRWTSENATRCSYIWREGVSGTLITETSSPYEYSNRLGTSGWIYYDGWPRWINETTTFYITCYNDNIGAEYTASLTVNVENPPPPDDPWLSMWGTPDNRNVVRSELYGYAWVPNIGYSAGNVTTCTQRALYEDGTLSPPPPGFFGRTHLYWNYRDIRLATTTIFEVTCSRPAVTIGGITYPAASITRQIQMNVLMPAGVDGDVTSWDRTTLPPVTVSLNVTPDLVTRDPYTGNSTVVAVFNRDNASRCYLRAYQENTITGEYTSQYTLSNWTGRTITGNGTTTTTINSLNRSTLFEVECIRDYDASLENGRDIARQMVIVEESPIAIPDPKLYLYGNAVWLNATRMWNASADAGRVGFNFANSSFIENTSPAASTNQLTIPFPHPFGAGDYYDVWARVCDTSYGESVYNLYTQNSGMVGSTITNVSTDPSITWCGSAGAWQYERIAQNVRIDNGETVTIECISNDDSERCTIGDMYFGAVGALTTPQVNPVVTSVTVPILVMSEHATFCGGSMGGHVAYRPNGTSYTWWGSPTVTQFNHAGNIRGVYNVPIATSTRFTLGCGRPWPADGLNDREEFGVFVPYSTTLTAQTTIGTGQCIDRDTLQPTEPPIGYGLGTDSPFCVPLVDLGALGPALNFTGASTNNVNGTHQNLRSLMVIENIGLGNLPADSNIAYKARLLIMPVHGMLDVESSVGYFNGELIAPTDPETATQSGTLNRTFTSDIPFGTHLLCARVNLDGSPNFPEVDSNEVDRNNEACSTVTVPVPPPPMTLTADRYYVRQGQSATITWGVDVTYELQCSVRGAGGINQSFNTGVVGDGYTDTTTVSFTNTGLFQLECTEPITNTTFNEEIRVEVVPDYIEI